MAYIAPKDYSQDPEIVAKINLAVLVEEQATPKRLLGGFDRE